MTFESNEGDSEYLKSLKEQAWKVYYELEKEGESSKYSDRIRVGKNATQITTLIR